MPLKPQSQPTFVAMSVTMIAATNGNGFWNETLGWVAFKDATHFTPASVLQSKIGNPNVDVTWLTLMDGKPTASQPVVGLQPQEARLLIQIRGGSFESAYTDAPMKFDVIVRDLDNIGKGDADPCDDPETRALITVDNVIY